MEVMIPVKTTGFNISSPGHPSSLTAPPSPRRFGECLFSAPTSPRRVAEFYREFENFSLLGDQQERGGKYPFGCEDTPAGTPKSPRETVEGDDGDDYDFAFDIGGESETASVFAEELFDGGKIKPLKPPPRLQLDEFEAKKSPLSSPRSPRSPISQGKKLIRDAFSPKKKVVADFDPFETAIENTRKRAEQERGRGRSHHGSSAGSNRRAARSLSPFRVSAYPWEEEEEKRQPEETEKPSSLNSKASFSSTSSVSSYPSKGSSRRWRLRDFLLFRSASEGRGHKDSCRRYSIFSRKQEDPKNSSTLSTDSSSSSSGSRRKGMVSAHELHYTANKAASQDLRKKTFLPYKHGILGRFAFNPSVHARRS